MRKSLLLVLLVTLTSAFSLVRAQNPAERIGPPRVLLIVREEIKAGMMGAHNIHSANYASIFRRLGSRNERIAMVPVAGNENEVVYITGADSFAQLEQILQDTDKRMNGLTGSMKAESDRLDKEASLLHAGMREMLAVFRPELSFNPGIDVRTMRYFPITTVRVRPGHDAQYNEYVTKMVNVARQKAKLEGLHIAGFQVISGAQAGTYMFFRPMKSLAEMDDPMAMRARAAMSDDMRKDADKMVGEAVMSSETSTYWLNPNMSYVENDFAAGDPAFWNPKPMMAAPKPKSRK